MAYRKLLLRVLTAGLASAACSSALHAADLDVPYVGSQSFPEDKVEFGTGWYIRGDLGATRLPSVSNTSTSIYSAPSATITTGDDVGYTASLGAGYQINRWFRVDLIGDFHQPVSSSFSTASGSIPCTTGIYYTTNTNGSTTQNVTNGGCSGTYSAVLRSYDVLLNGYVDLGTWYGVTPYVGAGVGLSFGHYQTSSTYTQLDGSSYNVYYTDPNTGETFHGDYDHHASGTYYNLAWALMAGFAVDIFDHTKLDVGYRYLNLGSIPGVTSKALTSQEVRVGIRYMIDN